MKRVQYLHYGGPEELRLDEVKHPDPGRGQIRIRVKAAAATQCMAGIAEAAEWGRSSRRSAA